MRATFLSIAALAAPLSAFVAAPDGASLGLEFNKDVYLPGETAYLTVTAAPGTLFWLGFDKDPGPTTIPGIGEFQLGFSSAFLYTDVPLGPIPAEGSVELSWSCSNPCQNPITGTDIYIQGVALDPVTLEICISNPEVLNVEDLYSDCDAQGCTPGYWKNHPETWPSTGYAPDDDFDAVFGVDYFDPDMSLIQALQPEMDGTLAAHATAALLNAAHPGTDYGLLPNEVIALLQQAVAGDAALQEEIKDQFDHLNNSVCPF